MCAMNFDGVVGWYHFEVRHLAVLALVDHSQPPARELLLVENLEHGDHALVGADLRLRVEGLEVKV